MSSCPLRCAAHIFSQWWSARPLFLGVRQLRRFIGEEDLRRSAVNALGLQPGDRVLNMCSGLGDNLRLLRGSDIELIAADTCRDNAEACRREIRENRWQNIRALHWNGYTLPFDDASFDAIFITYGFTGAEHPGSIIAECARLLKPGGRIAVIDWITPGKGNGFFAGLLWPLHFLMGCNPYTPWRRQFAEYFEVCKQQKIWADMAAFIYAQKRLTPASGDSNFSAGLDFADEPSAETKHPSNAFCGIQYAMAHERVQELREARRAAREAEREAQKNLQPSAPQESAAESKTEPAAETGTAVQDTESAAKPSAAQPDEKQPETVPPEADSIQSEADDQPNPEEDSAETAAAPNSESSEPQPSYKDRRRRSRNRKNH